MVHLLDLLEHDVIALFGEFIVLERLAVNKQSQADVALSKLWPPAEQIWETWCRDLGVCSSPANGEPWRKWFGLCVQRLRQAVTAGDLGRVRDLVKNFRKPEPPFFWFEVPTDILRDALIIGNDGGNGHMLRELFAFGTAPDAANDLGEALVAHASESSVQSFRAIAHHLQRWNIKITALHYSQAASQVREQGSSHLSHDFRKVPAPDAV